MMTGAPDDENSAAPTDPAVSEQIEAMRKSMRDYRDVFEALAGSHHSDDPSEQLWRDLEKIDGDDTAAREHLAAGRAIYYVENDTPEGLQIKEYPNGRRELVRFHREGDEVIHPL